MTEILKPKTQEDMQQMFDELSEKYRIRFDSVKEEIATLCEKEEEIAILKKEILRLKDKLAESDTGKIVRLERVIQDKITTLSNVSLLTRQNQPKSKREKAKIIHSVHGMTRGYC
jgi:uncharacterized small protein (DUF1192 family)